MPSRLVTQAKRIESQPRSSSPSVSRTSGSKIKQTYTADNDSAKQLKAANDNTSEREAYSNGVAQAQLMRKQARAAKMPNVGILGKVKQAEAVRVSITIFATAIPFWFFQVAIWMVGIGGLGLESIPFANYVMPGDTLYMLSYMLIAGLGICTMVYATFVYGINRINCFGGSKMLVFMFCMTGYLVIFINGFPWFILWLLAVSKMQTTEQS
jgi:hypothetical protein